MSPGSSTESYPAFACIGLRENPGKNLNQTIPLWSGRTDKTSYKSFYKTSTASTPISSSPWRWSQEGSLPFLDIHIHRKADGTLGHGIYRKLTHTDLYLNALSLHHPSQKKSVLTSSLHRAIVISDINNLPAEMDHLCRTLQQNNYSRRDINKALKLATTRRKTIDLHSKQESTRKAFIPFCGSVSHKISRTLQKLNIKTIHKPQRKIRSHLRQVKDSQGLRTPGIYKIPCECSEVYIGQTGRTIEDRIKEHKRNLRLYYPEKSAVAQHSIEKEHKILFDHTKVINKSSHYWERTIKEAI
ncbi:hypothetical protein ANN_21271 [Periplaneta americana]|uniref:GIY-YIG domain-containing protein n=1 Tax=Periplaneta americana TaxID=6978 RepID=A0ABQ8SF71_PERAM|nr:hypothetical protein ANN_21271 [Periplaneta americana]